MVMGRVLPVDFWWDLIESAQLIYAVNWILAVRDLWAVWWIVQYRVWTIEFALRVSLWFQTSPSENENKTYRQISLVCIRSFRFFRFIKLFVIFVTRVIPNTFSRSKIEVVNVSVIALTIILILDKQLVSFNNSKKKGKERIHTMASSWVAKALSKLLSRSTTNPILPRVPYPKTEHTLQLLYFVVKDI